MPENQTFKPSKLGVLPVTIVLSIFAIFMGLPALIVSPLSGLLIVGFIVIILFFVYLSIKLTSYELHADGLFIRRGIIAKKQILLLYTQIQDVTEYRDLWGRIAGLKALQIKTMTASSALAGNINNLTEADADALKQLLLQQVNSRSKKASQKNVSSNNNYNMGAEQDEKASNPYPTNFYKIGLIYVFVCISIALIILVFVKPSTHNLEIAFDLIWIIIIIMSVPIRYFIQQFTFKYWIGNNTITIKSGLINTQKTSIEYEKVQDFIITQGILQRIVGLANIHLETGSAIIYATSDDKHQRPNYEICELKLEDARALSDKIMKKTGINYIPSNKPLVQEIPLNQKKVIKKTISGLIGLFIISVIIFVIAWITISGSDNSSQAKLMNILIWVAIIFIALAILMLIYQKLYYDRYYYDQSKNTLTIRKGVIGRKQIFLSFEKIQNVFMDQDLLDRAFGLYDVHVSTVGQGSIRMCHIDGLTKENADKMKAVLLKQVKANN